MTRTTDAAHPTGVVVGVDGTPAGVNAARHALAEAARCGVSLDVVHVVPEDVPVGGRHVIPPDHLVEAGRSVLRSVTEGIGPAPDGVAVHTRLERGAVVPTLAELGRDARVVVVGSDRRPASMRLLTGNVSTGVAARCQAPVVTVPETWPHDRTTGVVLVGIKHLDRPAAALSEAIDVAREHHARVLVVHAWQFPYAYDDNLASDRVAHAAWTERALEELRELVDVWQEGRPGLELELRSVEEQAAHALVAASAEADEVVIARRAHGVPRAAHLGPTARAVLMHAHCPVRVVPADRAAPRPGLEERRSASGAVVVGITGRGRDSAALRLAADCARRDGLEVLLVHAFQDSSAADPPGYVLPHEEAEKIAVAVVEEVSAEFEELVGGSVVFRAVAVPGAAARVLADLGTYATLVVAQHSRATALGRLFVGSTVDGAAAHAGCPVVSVDEGWEPGAPRGDVVVGVDGRGGPPDVLEAAFDWAVATGAPLRVVHAGRLDSA